MQIYFPALLLVKVWASPKKPFLLLFFLIRASLIFTCVLRDFKYLRAGAKVFLLNSTPLKIRILCSNYPGLRIKWASIDWARLQGILIPKNWGLVRRSNRLSGRTFGQITFGTDTSSIGIRCRRMIYLIIIIFIHNNGTFFRNVNIVIVSHFVSRRLRRFVAVQHYWSIRHHYTIPSIISCRIQKSVQRMTPQK